MVFSNLPFTLNMTIYKMHPWGRQLQQFPLYSCLCSTFYTLVRGKKVIIRFEVIALERHSS